MEVIVFPAKANAWRLRDQLGRDLGGIARVAAGALVIMPGHLLSDLHRGPFLSLALAMSEISREAHDPCRFAD